jgi:glycosyltransferase involved in cell wall biosynthesis
MRICLVNREMAPLFGAGIGTYVAEMARAWTAAGHEVHVLGVNDPAAPTRGPMLFPGVSFHAPGALDESDERVLWRSEIARRAQQVRRTLARLHVAHPFDYIEFPEYYAEGALAIRGGAALGELPGATLGVRLHSPDRLCRELNADPILGFNRLLTDRFEMESVAMADVVLSPTGALLEWCRDELRAHGQTIRGHAAVVPYPFDAGAHARLDPAMLGANSDPHSASHGGAGNGPEILYFGRLERRKGVDLLVRAFNRLVEEGVVCTLTMIGGDTSTGPGGISMRSHLDSLLSDAARRLATIEGPCSRTELVPRIRRVTASGGLCCFPSRWENFPNVVLEAMSLGAPVVCADSSGMAEIVQHGHSGLLFEAGSVEGLADALMLTLADRSLRGGFGVEGPAQIRALCDPARVVAQTIEAIERGRVHRVARALPAIGDEPPTVAEVVIEGVGSWPLILEAACGGMEWVLVRGAGGGGHVDPRLVGAGARIMRADRSIAMVTAGVIGPARESSWAPFGLDRSALAALDLSGLGAASLVRSEAIRGAQAVVEDGLSMLGAEGSGGAVAWVLAAALASARWGSVVLPEPWIGLENESGAIAGFGDPYLVMPGQHRARVASCALLERAGSLGPDAGRLMASVLPARG